MQLMRDYRFKPSRFAVLLVLLLVPAFVGLGFWQLNRAGEREALNRLQDERSQESTLMLGGQLDAIDPATIRYRNLTLHGEFDAAHQFLVDNQLEDQRAGYHVLVPFRISGGETAILVNRGWLPLGSDRMHLPDLHGLPEGVVTIEGRADLLHRVGFRLKGAEIPSEGWPAVVQLPEPEALGSRLGYKLAGFQVLLAPSEPGGYSRHFRMIRLDANKNRGYALQWFLFAATCLFLFARSSFRKSVSPS